MGRSWRWLGAACLVGFPLLFIVLAGTGIHPGPLGTTQQQIQQVAAAEGPLAAGAPRGGGRLS